MLGVVDGSDPASAPSTHAADAVFDDAVLPDGAAFLAELALRRLPAAPDRALPSVAPPPHQPAGALAQRPPRPARPCAEHTRPARIRPATRPHPRRPPRPAARPARAGPRRTPRRPHAAPARAPAPRRSGRTPAPRQPQWPHQPRHTRPRS